jgi:glyoxylase-like metal-dependent hydrolase (beta-lactamase superfamily II)
LATQANKPQRFVGYACFFHGRAAFAKVNILQATFHWLQDSRFAHVAFLLLLANFTRQGPPRMVPPLEIQTIVSAPFSENSYVVRLPGKTSVLVIDPGLEPELISDCLKDQDLTAVAILNTHGHADHIGGNGYLKGQYPQAPIVIGANEAHMLTDADANLSAPFGLPVVSPQADRLVYEGDIVDYAGIPLEVLEVPGHSPGHVVFLYRSDPPVLFGGDVLFRESIGRYDFPGCDGRLLFSGIRAKLFSLPPATIVYPGHGPVTTIGHEKQANPFVGDNSTFQE